MWLRRPNHASKEGVYDEGWRGKHNKNKTSHKINTTGVGSHCAKRPPFHSGRARPNKVAFYDLKLSGRGQFLAGSGSKRSDLSNREELKMHHDPPTLPQVDSICAHQHDTQHHILICDFRFPVIWYVSHVFPSFQQISHFQHERVYNNTRKIPTNTNIQKETFMYKEETKRINTYRISQQVQMAITTHNNTKQQISL